MAKHSSHIMALARRGAEHRVKQLQDELATIQKHFPDLVSHAGRLIKRGAVAAVSTIGGVTPEEGGREGHGARKGSKKRRKLSAAGRAAISKAAKARWAKVRKAGK
jgi:hypothetical protein